MTLLIGLTGLKDCPGSDHCAIEGLMEGSTEHKQGMGVPPGDQPQGAAGEAEEGRRGCEEVLRPAPGREEEGEEGREAGPLSYYQIEHTKNVRDWKEVFDFAVQDPTPIPSSYQPLTTRS